jgi:predicted RNA binding protein YcfA (HicA-like mRNA interferase family)
MSSEERFAIVRKPLEDDGWKLARISSSHHIFEKPGRPLLSVPVHRGKVKPVYVRRIREIIEEKD